MSTGIPVRSEPYDRRQALWNEIKANAERFRGGECGRFLPDLQAHFLSQFDASLLLLAVAFQENNEQFEGSAFFGPRELEVFEKMENFSYFRILSKSEIAKKIRSKDEKTLKLLREYSVFMKQWVDDTLEDATVRDSLRNYLKKQWGDTTKKIGEAIAVADVDLDWFTSLKFPSDDRKPAQTIINITAGNDAAINLGNGTVVKDAVMTGSRIESSGGGGTTVKDSVLTKSTIETSGTSAPASSSGVLVSDSILTGSSIKNIQESAPVPDDTVCKKCGNRIRQGSKFCNDCGEIVPVLCKKCGTGIPPVAKFCIQCGERVTK